MLPLLQLGGDERVYNTLRRRYNWTTFSYNGHELGGVYFKYLELVTRHKSTSHKLLNKCFHSTVVEISKKRYIGKHYAESLCAQTSPAYFVMYI